MLRDILENETAIGLSNKELLGEQDACKTVSSTTVYRRPVKEKLGKPTNIARVQAEELYPEVYRLETEARWHEREAEKRRKRASR